MEPVDVNRELARSGLKPLELCCLAPTGTEYDAMVFQPRGKLRLDSTGCRLNDNSPMIAKFKGFLGLAKRKNTSLALSPEYSCPWETVKWLARDECFPAIGNVCVLGCQSISKVELNGVRDELPDVEVIYDGTVLSNQKAFLNPVCYFFMARKEDGQSQRVILLQFKCIPSNDSPRDIEQHHMICGSKIYILSNGSESSIKLATIICSDALDFPRGWEGWLGTYHPFLIIHLQLNREPRHQDIREYRRVYFNRDNETKEVVALNWARQTEIVDRGSISFSGSALYCKTKDVDLRDARINENHVKGVYYSYWANQHSHVHYINCNEGVYHYCCTKVAQGSTAASQTKRAGPRMVQAYHWSEESEGWAVFPPNDGMLDWLRENSLVTPSLEQSDLSQLDNERMLMLSSGKISRGTKDVEWYDVRNLRSFSVEDKEISKRIAFAHDTADEALEWRRLVVTNFRILMDIVNSQGDEFPDCIADLKESTGLVCRVDSDREYECNLYRADDLEHEPATVVYAGSVDVVEAQVVWNALSRVIKDDRQKRLVVWYTGSDLVVGTIIPTDNKDIAGEVKPSSTII